MSTEKGEFSVGDRVRLINVMPRMLGKVGTINEICTNEYGVILDDEKDNPYWFSKKGGSLDLIGIKRFPGKSDCTAEPPKPSPDPSEARLLYVLENCVLDEFLHGQPVDEQLRRIDKAIEEGQARRSKMLLAIARVKAAADHVDGLLINGAGEESPGLQHARSELQQATNHFCEVS